LLLSDAQNCCPLENLAITRQLDAVVAKMAATKQGRLLPSLHSTAAFPLVMARLTSVQASKDALGSVVWFCVWGENDGHGHNGDTNADKNLFHLISF